MSDVEKLPSAGGNDPIEELMLAANAIIFAEEGRIDYENAVERIYRQDRGVAIDALNHARYLGGTAVSANAFSRIGPAGDVFEVIAGGSAAIGCFAGLAGLGIWAHAHTQKWKSLFEKY